MGRSSEYTDEIAATICELIVTGHSLRQIQNMDGMPTKTTILKWLCDNPKFADQYAQARAMQAEHFADEILEICDDGTNDWMTRQQGEEVVTVADHEHISRSKLRVDARKWLMSKMSPKKYGDKVALTGANDGPLAFAVVDYAKALDTPSS